MRSRLRLVAVFLLCAFTVSFYAPYPSPFREVVSVSPDPLTELVVARQRVEQRAGLDRYYEGVVTAAAKQPTRVATKESEHAAHFEPGSVEQMILDVFGDAGPQALRVANCESHYNPDAYNPSGASGVFQIMMPTHAWRFVEHGWTAGDVFDAYRNIVVAYDIWLDSGWRPWSCAA